MMTPVGLFQDALPAGSQEPGHDAGHIPRTRKDLEVNARRYLVTGRVQGVGFRWFVVNEARSLGLSGWTRNLSGGGVEVVAQGDPGALDALAASLAQGPPAARVDRVSSSEEMVDARRLTFDVTF